MKASGVKRPLSPTVQKDGDDNGSGSDVSTPQTVKRMARQLAGMDSDEGSSSTTSSSTDGNDSDFDCPPSPTKPKVVEKADSDPNNEFDWESDTEGVMSTLMNPKPFCHDELQSDQTMHCASMAAKQAEKSDWPEGPKTYQKLFEWPAFFSDVLLRQCDSSAENLHNCSWFLSHDIHHDDSFSGLGTASIQCKMQMQSHWRALQAAGHWTHWTHMFFYCNYLQIVIITLANCSEISFAAGRKGREDTFSYTCGSSCDHDNISQHVLTGLNEETRIETVKFLVCSTIPVCHPECCP